MNNINCYIRVPLDEIGKKEIEQCRGIVSDHVWVEDIGLSGYQALESCGLFDELNSEIDLLIDLAESEIIANDRLEQAIAIVGKYQVEQPQEQAQNVKKLLRALEKACEVKTYVEFYF